MFMKCPYDDFEWRIDFEPLRLRARFEATRILASKVLVDAMMCAANSPGGAERVGFSYKSTGRRSVPALPVTVGIKGCRFEFEAGRRLQARLPIFCCRMA